MSTQISRVAIAAGVLALATTAGLAGQRGAPAAPVAPVVPGVNVAIDADDVGGVVRSPNGPEAGVWVIAETADFPIKFRKIVVTDDQGRYVLPDLLKASYQVWVRGYGLVDSSPVKAAPGQ
jgi:hypothetical protein